MVWQNGVQIPGQVRPKTQKMVLDATLLNIQHNKVRIKGKVEQSREIVLYNKRLFMNFSVNHL